MKYDSATRFIFGTLVAILISGSWAWSATPSQADIDQMTADITGSNAAGIDSGVANLRAESPDVQAANQYANTLDIDPGRRGGGMGQGFYCTGFQVTCWDTTNMSVVYGQASVNMVIEVQDHR